MRNGAGEAFRSEVLAAHGARGESIRELLGYTENSFNVSPQDYSRTYPLPDEDSVASWQRYVDDSRRRGVFECLMDKLVQLRFPIATGISRSPAYRAVTRRGAPPPDGCRRGLELRDPRGLRLLVHPTPAGRIPVLIASHREDFEALVRALTQRNEPIPVPTAVGAMMVSGYNNWDRVRDYRQAWQARNQGADWSLGFRQLIPEKHLYQDRLILLSSGPYSDVPATSLGLSRSEWQEKSMSLRLEHECAHYFTRRVFGIMNNNLHDEVIADYLGIAVTEGRFRGDWFLRFLGLEDHPRFRPGGRLANYRGDPPLSDGAFEVLRSLIRSIASHLDAADFGRPARDLKVEEKARILCGLASLTLEEMAAEDGVDRLARVLTRP